jgi:hypothetical protein
LKLVNRQTGEIQDLPDEQVQDAFQGGTHAFIHGEQRVPIRTPEGEIRSVAAKDAQRAIELGASIASEAEYHAADLDARYGDFGHALAAAGEGVARGLSVGTVDPLAIGAAKLFGGGSAAKATREHLAGEKEAHPYLSTGGEVVGAVLPALLSEGGTVPEEAAALGGERLAAAGAENLAAAGAEKAVVGGTERAAAGVGEPLDVASSIVKRAPDVGPPHGAPQPVSEGYFYEANQADINRAQEFLDRRGVVGPDLSSVPANDSFAAQYAADARALPPGPMPELPYAEPRYLGAGRNLHEPPVSKPPLVEAPAGAAPGPPPVAPEPFAPEVAPPSPVKAPSFVSQALQYTPAGLTSQFGLAAERAAGEVLGATAGKGAIGRIINAGARAAAAAGVESPIYAAGDYLSESYLGNEDLNGEKFVAAVGHGFLYGTLFGAAAGGGLAGLGEAAGPLLRRAKPYLDKAAAEQAAKATYSTLKASREVEMRAGGAAEYGETLLRRGVIPDSPVKAANMTAEDFLARAEVAREQVGKEIGAAERIHGINAMVDAAELDSRIAKVYKPMEGSAALEDVARDVKAYRDNLFDKLGVETDPALAEIKATKVANSTSYLRDSPKWRETYDLELKRLSRKEVPYADVARQRRDLDAKIYRETSPLVGNAKLEELRKTRAIMADLEVDAMDKAARKIGVEDARTAFKRLRKDYQHMSIAEDQLADKVARANKNNFFSLTEHIGGGAGLIAGAVGGLAAGHLAAGAIAGNLAGKYGRKLVREHGNVIAASTLHKLASLDLIARATRSVDAELDAAIGSLTGRTKPRLRVRRFSGPDDKSSPEKKYEDAHGTISPYGHVADSHVEDALPGMTLHAPKTSNAVVRAINDGVVYMKSKMPTPLNAPSIVDPNPKPRVDDVSAEEFHSIRRAVDDPVGVLRDGIEDGKITRAQVEAIKATKPALVEDVQRRLLEELARPRSKDIPYDKLTSISLIFGVAADPTLDPAHVQQYQSVYPPSSKGPDEVPGPNAHQPKASTSQSLNRPLKHVAESHSLSLDRASMAH